MTDRLKPFSTDELSAIVVTMDLAATSGERDTARVMAIGWVNF